MLASHCEIKEMFFYGEQMQPRAFPMIGCVQPLRKCGESKGDGHQF